IVHPMSAGIAHFPCTPVARRRAATQRSPAKRGKLYPPVGRPTPMRPDRDITDPRMAKALAHPLRVRILGLLDNRVASPNEIANEIGASLGVVRYHVRTLVGLGFLELVGKRQRRGATEHYYRAVSRPVVTSEAWEKMPSVVKKAMVGATLGHVSDLVNLAAHAGGFE